VPPQHGDGRGAGGRRRLRGDPGGHPGGVLQVRRRELHRDPPTRRRSGAQLRKGQSLDLVVSQCRPLVVRRENSALTHEA